MGMPPAAQAAGVGWTTTHSLRAAAVRAETGARTHGRLPDEMRHTRGGESHSLGRTKIVVSLYKKRVRIHRKTVIPPHSVT